MLYLNKTDLFAATFNAAKKDIRYYIKNVLVEVTNKGTVYIVSTDGATLFCGQVKGPRWTESQPTGGLKLLVPVNVIKTACKGRGEVKLEKAGDRWLLGDTLFTAGEGVFPDWRRVAMVGEHEPAVSYFDPVMLASCDSALKVWFNNKKLYTKLHQRGIYVGAVTGCDNSAFCLIMPLHERVITDVKPFTPEPF